MKGYIVKYSTGSYDDHCTHDVKVFLDRKEADRYCIKFNKVLSMVKEFYKSKRNEYYDASMEDYEVRTEYWDILYDKYQFYCDMSEPWLEEIEIVESVKKKGNTRWD